MDMVLALTITAMDDIIGTLISLLSQPFSNNLLSTPNLGLRHVSLD